MSASSAAPQALGASGALGTPKLPRTTQSSALGAKARNRCDLAVGNSAVEAPRALH